MINIEFKKKISIYLKNLQIKRGDTLLVNINLFKIGRLRGFSRADYLESFIDYLGPNGTLISLAYTDSKFSLHNKNLPYFDGSQKAITGAFSNIMIDDPRSYRSMHPTHSVVAIGKEARFITNDINHNSSCYEPIKRLISLNGKILLIGMEDFPGFITHVAQERLSLLNGCWFDFFNKVKTTKGIVRIQGGGGCSKNFYKFYSKYRERNVLNELEFFKAKSMSIDARTAFRIDTEILKAFPSFTRCSGFDCAYCSIGHYNQLWKLPIFLIMKLIIKPRNFLEFFQRQFNASN